MTDTEKHTLIKLNDMRPLLSVFEIGTVEVFA